MSLFIGVGSIEYWTLWVYVGVGSMGVIGILDPVGMCPVRVIGYVSLFIGGGHWGTGPCGYVSLFIGGGHWSTGPCGYVSL